MDHHVFWDLQHAARYVSIEVEPTRLETPIPILGAGELGRYSQGFVDDINGRTAELEAALARVKNEGRFLAL